MKLNINVMLLIVILVLILFLGIGIITLYFMYATSTNVPKYAWFVPIMFIIIPTLLLKDFIFNFFANFNSIKSYDYTSKNNNIDKVIGKINYTNEDEKIIVNKISVSKIDLIQFINSGQKLLAVKYLKETANLDLLSAKIIIDKFILENYSQIQVEKNQYNSDIEKLIDKSEINKLLSNGKKIEAVKYVMEKAKIEIKTAKDYVDKF
jgi:ribosomal protein L7/L12